MWHEWDINFVVTVTLRFKLACYHRIMWEKINTLVFLNLVFFTQDNGFWVYIYIYIYSFCSGWPVKNVVVQSPSQVWPLWPSQVWPLYDPMGCSTPGLAVPHYLLKLTQVYVHRIDDAIQPSHPLMPSSSALSLSKHQRLFQWGIYLHLMTKILKLQLPHQTFQQIFRVDFS